MPNTTPGSNINIRKIFGDNEYFLLARSLFDASGLPNHGKSDLVHAVTNYIHGVWIGLWQGKLDVVVIDAMRAIFHLPKSTKFYNFLNVFRVILNQILKET